ncbi:site-specific integrase [Spartinivicinus ruber]|uniref:site-specific integrase n=1 Tax=Spartinivicinus ruber TaxID=2683272 RepID=UPI0013D43D60|nr:site-specific integrase [Spartinivicinus ruber]
MAFKRQKTRKTVKAKDNSSAEVYPISVESMVINDSYRTVHFKRLGYKGCPNLSPGSKNKSFKSKRPEDLVDMNRWDLVQSLYINIKGMDKSERTKTNIYQDLCKLIKACDEANISDIFSVPAIEKFVSTLKTKYTRGAKGKTQNSIQYSIKTLIAEMALPNERQVLDCFYKFPNDSTPTEPYTDDELKVILRNLYKILNSYKSHLLEKTTPDTFPLFNDKNTESNDKISRYIRFSSSRKISYKRNSSTWKQDLVICGYFITCFFTGVNQSSLLNLKHSDIKGCSFIESSKGKYLLQTTKGRQNYQRNLHGVGFTARGKDFFETWLRLSKLITSNSSGYVFPKVTNDVCSKMNNSHLYSGINTTFKMLGLPALSAKRFRKTKASIIMRATNSIFSVAESLNNSPSTVDKHYSDGDQVTNQITLAKALEVRERSAKGEPIREVIHNIRFQFKDPVREYNYQKNGLTTPPLSPCGLRCESPFGKKAEQLKKTLQEVSLATKRDRVACYKFLECFGCEHHAVIAEVEDIWMILSFRDVIDESLARPSVNSIPTSLLTKVLNTINYLLKRLEKDHNKTYMLALEQYNDEPHPLWSDYNDLGMLMEVWS